MEKETTIALEDIRWTYSQVHSQMHYNGLTLDEACIAVEKTFDGSQPKGLFEAVKAYHNFKRNQK